MIFFDVTNSINWSTSLLYARMVAVERPSFLRSATKSLRAASRFTDTGFIK